MNRATGAFRNPRGTSTRTARTNPTARTTRGTRAAIGNRSVRGRDSANSRPSSVYRRSSGTATGRRGSVGHQGASNRRYGYNRPTQLPAGRHASGRGQVSARHYYNNGYRHRWYFGHGRYYGSRYYYPWYDYYSRHHYAFFYPAPVVWAFAPYGFYYGGYEPVYVTETVYVRDEYQPERYEAVDEQEGEYQPEQEAEGEPESGEAEVKEEQPPPQEEETVDPEPAADSPATEKFLREASEAFHKADYDTAAQRFRLAAISAPESAAPLFALGQSLVALGKDDYAARVIRHAVGMSPELLKQPGDISGVYRDRAEFDRVSKQLAGRAKFSADARFLVGVQRYFSGDPRCRDDFRALAANNPNDTVVGLFVTEIEARFKPAKDLPEIK